MKFPLVEIKWDDAVTDTGWQHADEIEPSNEVAITIGFLVKETPKHVVVASTIDADGSTNGRIQIPVKMILKRTVIRKPK